VALQCAQSIPLGIKDVDLGIIQSHDDVFGSEMQARDDAAVLCDVARHIVAAGPPGCIHQVPLFEVRLVRPEHGSGIGTAIERGR
jgi:hypothetical protein